MPPPLDAGCPRTQLARLAQSSAMIAFLVRTEGQPNAALRCYTIAVTESWRLPNHSQIGPDPSYHRRATGHQGQGEHKGDGRAHPVAERQRMRCRRNGLRGGGDASADLLPPLCRGIWCALGGG